MRRRLRRSTHRRPPDGDLSSPNPYPYPISVPVTLKGDERNAAARGRSESNEPPPCRGVAEPHIGDGC